MDSNAISLGILFPELEIILVILWLDKADLAVVSALNDMIGISRKVHPCTSWHSISFAI